MRRLLAGAQAGRPAATFAGAAFATAALGFLALRAGLAFGGAAAPLATGIPAPVLPPLGSRLLVPQGTSAVLALPACGSCRLRSLPPEAVRAAAQDPGLLILGPEPKPRKELDGARATVWQGSKALALGPWAAAGPALVRLDAQGRAASATLEPKAVAEGLAGLGSEGAGAQGGPPRRGGRP